MPPALPIKVGMKFGRLTVDEQITVMKPTRAFRCTCQCGKAIVVDPSNLRRARVVSCGCFHRDNQRARLIKQQTTHGEAGRTGRTPEYQAWVSIKNRCFNHNIPEYPWYGARGIVMCEEWRNSYPAFLAHVGRRPSPKHSIDRIRVNGNYEPGNVKWATDTEQSRNRRSNHMITFNGITLCMTEWAEAADMNYKTLRGRILAGWPIEKALTEPVIPGQKFHTKLKVAHAN